MKIIVSLFFISLTVLYSCNSKPKFIAEGIVNNPVFEGSKIYLLSLDAPASKKIDSTAIKDLRFRFEIPADSLGVKILRIPAKFPDVIDDLIIITEPGTINVQLSSSSSGSGTRLNDMLMDWKSQKNAYDSIQFDIYMRQGSPGTNPAISDSLLKQSREMAEEHLSYVLNAIDQNLYNGIGLLFFKVYYKDLPKEKRKEILDLTGDLYLNKDLQVWSMVTMDKKLGE